MKKQRKHCTPEEKVAILNGFRIEDYTSNEVSRLSGFPGHRSTRAEQSMELENLELD
jgi:hypothetical protein